MKTASTDNNHSTWDSLPSGWAFDRMKDVVDLRDEKVFVESEEPNYLELEDLEGGRGRILSRRDTLTVESAVTRFTKGDVLFGKLRPYLEKYARPDFDGFCTGEILAFHPRRIDGNYLFYHMGSDWLIQRCNSLAYGAKMPRVNWPKQLALFDIPLPPLPEQKRIAAYLDASCAAIDRAVETKRKQLETLDALRKSIIQKAVTQGLNPKVKMKDSGVEWLGPIPAHWKIEKLKRCGRLKGGAGFPHDEQGVTDAEIPFYKVKHLQAQRYLTDCDNFVTVETARRLGAEIMPPDTIVFAKVGAALLLNRFRILTRPCCIDNNMTALIIERSEYRMPYFFHVLNLLDLGEFANQGPVPSINGAQVGAIRVPVPPAAEQDSIVEFVENRASLFQSLTSSIQSQITTLTAYRRSLIHECVTGKRRISDADVAKVEAHV